MKRTKIKSIDETPPDAILTSDWHLREDVPVCRTDDFWATQWRKVDWVAELQRKHGCPVIHAGDLFDHWKPSPYLLSMTMKHLPANFWTVFGQHDLPQHNLELKHKSGIFALETAKALRVLFHGHWGDIPKDTDKMMGWSDENRRLYVWHNLVYVGKKPFPKATGKARTILEKYKKFDLIVTGDNHQSFMIRGMGGNLLVNPGSLMRQTADQIDFQPKVYLWYSKTNVAEPVNIPIEPGVVSREHIEVVNRHNEQLDAFIVRFRKEWEKYWKQGQVEEDVNLFEDNVKQFFHENQTINPAIKKIIYKSIEP